MSDPQKIAEEAPIPEVIPSVSQFTGSLLTHLQALVALFILESKEAGVHGLRISVILLAAAVFGAFAYLFFLLFVVFLLNALLKVDWIWICLGVATVHVLAATILLWLGKNSLHKKMFTATAETIRKDIDALKAANP